jgi:peptidylprolyl isomerase
VISLRRVPALLGLASLLLTGLTACGSDDSGAESSGSVTVAGEFGKAPEVTYDGRVERTSSETTVLTEGDGATIEDGGSALAHLYIGNGYTGEEALSTWEQKRPTVLSSGEQSLPALREAIAGQQVGSRVQVLASPEDAYAGTGNPNLYIGNQDTVLFVVDILSEVLDAPEGEEQEAPAGLPSITEKDGKVTALDFADAEPAEGGLQVIPLVEGEGPAVEKGDAIAMRYLGQVEGKKKPFDENYSAEQIEPFRIGTGELIKGWDRGLVGVTQGSRVMLVIPPKLAYPKGNDQAGIKATDTLYFVVDVLGVE